MIADGVLGRSLRGLRVRSRGRSRRGARTGVRATWRLWLLLTVLALGAAAGGGWLWLRDSGLVAVQRVSVTGVSGPDAAQIRASLEVAARGMTTLDLRMRTLRAAVSPYPVVAGLRVSTQFPHGLRIRVLERQPVAAITVGSQTIPVAADGTILRDVRAVGRLPALSVRAAPGGPRLDDGAALSELRILAAAPRGMGDRVSTATSDYWHGVVLQLRQGPSVYFASDAAAQAKWRAVLALLATPANAGASYLDVTDPSRPAAGTGGTVSSLAGTGTGLSTTTGSQQTSPTGG